MNLHNLSPQESNELRFFKVKFPEYLWRQISERQLQYFDRDGYLNEIDASLARAFNGAYEHFLDTGEVRQ